MCQTLKNHATIKSERIPHNKMLIWDDICTMVTIRYKGPRADFLTSLNEPTVISAWNWIRQSKNIPASLVVTIENWWHTFNAASMHQLLINIQQKLTWIPKSCINCIYAIVLGSLSIEYDNKIQYSKSNNSSEPSKKYYPH